VNLGAVHDPAALFRVGCCGLRAAVHVLGANGLPVPPRVELIAHPPDLVCPDALLLRPLESRREESFAQGGLGDNTFRSLTVWELSLSRRVCVGDPLAQGGDCAGSSSPCDERQLGCPGEPLVLEDPGECGARDKTEETLLLFSDRQVIESALAEVWSACMCEPGVGSDGETCAECGTPADDVKWVATSGHYGGQAGGSLFRFEVLS